MACWVKYSNYRGDIRLFWDWLRVQWRLVCRLRNFQKTSGFFNSIVRDAFLVKTANHVITTTFAKITVCELVCCNQNVVSFWILRDWESSSPELQVAKLGNLVGVLFLFIWNERRYDVLWICFCWESQSTRADSQGKFIVYQQRILHKRIISRFVTRKHHSSIDNLLNTLIPAIPIHECGFQLREI